MHEFWSYTIWPLTAHENGMSSWTVAYLGAHGYVQVLGGRLPYTCTEVPHCKLMLNLLLGARKHRYLRTRLVDPRPAQVFVRGFFFATTNC